MHTITHSANGVHPQTVREDVAFPEASCCINAHIQVEGLTHQVTGRGRTAEEAVANFRTTLTALRASAAPPPTRAQVVAELLATGFTTAQQRGDLGLVERLAQAAAFVLANAVTLHDDGTATVRAQLDADQWYDVNGTCTCTDGAPRERLCQHALAVAMARRVQARCGHTAVPQGAGRPQPATSEDVSVS
jgi:hypothetical protein